MVHQDKFNFFIPASFEKGKKNGENVTRVKGIASTVSAEDTDGETLFPDGFDYQPLLNKGFLNWDHQQKGRPSAIVGEPDVARVINGGKDFYIEGFLYPDSDEAQQVAQLAEVLEKNSPTRRLGYSIEGQVIERDPLNPKKVLRARITGVAITPCPKNPNTLMSLMKGEYSEQFVEDDNDMDTDLGKAYGELTIVKGGEGSKGGKVIGHTASGKPIYSNASHEAHKDFTSQDHEDAINIHQKVRDAYRKNDNSTDKDKADNDNAYEQQTVHISQKNRLFKESEEVKKAMTAEGASEAGLIPEHVEGFKNPNKAPLDQDKEHSVGHLIKKSDVYNLIAKKYTTDITKAKRIFNLIKSVNQKFFNMDNNNQITTEAIEKAFDFLDKANKDIIVKSNDNDQDDAYSVEKAKTACLDLMKGEGKMSAEDAEKELVKSGFSLEVAQTACAACVSEMSNLPENGGEVAAVTPTTVTGNDQSLSKADESTLIETGKEIAKSTDFEQLFKDAFGETNQLIKGLQDDVTGRFQAVGKILRPIMEQNEFLKGQVEKLSQSNSDISERLDNMENEEKPVKSARTVKQIEKFAKSEGAEASHPAGTSVYNLNSVEDRNDLLNIMDAEIQKSRNEGRTASEILVKAVSELEIVKSLPNEVLPYLRAMNIAVERK